MLLLRGAAARLGAIRLSPVVAVAATVLATFWGVWHSGRQTFGLARIDTRNAGNPPEAARRWEHSLSHLTYAGPVLAGATLVDHLAVFESFGDAGLPWLALGLQQLGRGPLHHEPLALTLVVSLMHFWYDGLVWPVARRQV